MSMANLIVQPDAAYIATDSGYFRKDGTIIGFYPKAMELADQSIAIASVGSLHLGYLARELQKWPDRKGWSQIEMLARLPGIVKDAYASSGLDNSERWSRFVIGFYSHKLQRALGMTFFTADSGGPSDKKPWVLYPAPVVLMPLLAMGEVYDGPVNLADPSFFDPHRDVMPMVEAQRRKCGGWGGIAEGCSAVAGEIVLTAVTRDGITHTVLHEYPDQVGQKAAA
ncbi:hypothetical protein [Rhizorhapis sp. SPR117]|uniref:hypothetical protein n=1 Tax=Rhizorhapis sp. SPR117 TaxID=2912611 RepID=UPI001F1EE649|nr:hypothetical protein [Rhizorhapis sp. SPR117]